MKPQTAAFLCMIIAALALLNWVTAKYHSPDAKLAAAVEHFLFVVFLCAIVVAWAFWSKRSKP